MPYNAGPINVRDTPIIGAGTSAQRIPIPGGLWTNLDDPANPVLQRYDGAAWVDYDAAAPTLPAWALAGNVLTGGEKLGGTDTGAVKLPVDMYQGNFRRARFSGNVVGSGLFELEVRVSNKQSGFGVLANAPANTALAFGSTNNSAPTAVFSVPVNNLADALGLLVCSQNYAANQRYLFVDHNGKTGINFLGTTDRVDVSAIMELRGVNGGLLFMRMTTTQRDAISSPKAGLMIYNTTVNKHQGYDGTAWNDCY